MPYPKAHIKGGRKAEGKSTKKYENANGTHIKIEQSKKKKKIESYHRFKI